ncbi:MAG: hypothetical protein HXS54_13910 [Theionarchaea archaeon]|nr:hypothetical protein [Theionarchaea archaeon]
MGEEKDVLKALRKGPRTFEELRTDFPNVGLSQLLIHMEGKHLVENRGGTWFSLEKRMSTLLKIVNIAVCSLLAVSIVYLLLLSSSYSAEFEDIQNHNQVLLEDKTKTEQQLSIVNQEKEDIDAVYAEKEDELNKEQNTTLELYIPLEEEQNAVDALQKELMKYNCLETCPPDTFVTVDNPYIIEKVGEITAGLTTLREKQEAVYEFVRDEILLNDYIYKMGREDLWEYPEDILKRGWGSWEDKFMVLLTMLRTAGTPQEDVRFIAADVDGNDSWAWVEVYDGSVWWILDPFEGYEFTSTPKDAFYQEHTVIVLWWFNDGGYYRD